MSDDQSRSPRHAYREGTGGLKSLVPPEWFQHPEDSSIWLRLYTCLFIPRAKWRKAVQQFLPELDDGQQFLDLGERLLFGFSTVKDMKVPVSSFQMFAQESGETMINVKMDQKELPHADYTLLAVPFKVDGRNGNEAHARRILDVASGLICLHSGLNFMRHCVFEGEVSGRDGSLSVPGEPWKMPQAPEGPFLAPQNGLDITEISTSMGGLSEPKRSRIDLALYLMDSAMRKNNGFFEYWTALEVVCDGKTNRIKDRIGRIYGIKSHKEAGERSGLNIIAAWRGDYVHKGKQPSLTADIERYLQLLFLDLLRHELGMPTRGHSAAMQQAPGYNLSSLGLADNRTEEQIKAADRTQGATQANAADAGA